MLVFTKILASKRCIFGAIYYNTTSAFARTEKGSIRSAPGKPWNLLIAGFSLVLAQTASFGYPESKYDFER
ncbi:hypothetical protein WBG83_12115 [Paenibacillus sp. y28]